MKKMLKITSFVMFMLISASCKKSENKSSTYEIRIVSEGTGYSLNAYVSTDMSKQYLDKPSLSGKTEFTINPRKTETVNVMYSTRAGMNLKIYVDNNLYGDHSLAYGNGGFSVRK